MQLREYSHFAFMAFKEWFEKKKFVEEKKLDEGVVLHSWSPRNIRSKTGLEMRDCNELPFVQD